MDLHRHDEYSTFDGFGKARELAKVAKELGHTALGISNHGNTNGLIQHYFGCKENGIKPIMGVEGYMLPKYTPQHRGFHLCLFAKNKKGYENLNTIQWKADAQKYYNPIWDFRILKKYSKGLICTSACVAGYLAQCVIKKEKAKAIKFIETAVDIFRDDFYIEIQPYKISDPGVQEKVNVALIKLACGMGVKCILTSDSHRGRKDELETYIKMHEMANHDRERIVGTYSERYMPSDMEMAKRFVKMHKGDFGLEEAKRMAKEMIRNLKEIEDKVDDVILEDLPLNLPKVTGPDEDSFKVLRRKCKQGLNDKGLLNKKYIDRCNMELDVIKHLNFSDYFLIVADYVNWAKDQGIAVGPGRGSACNSLVAFALGITNVDSLLFDLDFRRFLRKDKTKFPDIDIDFQRSRRAEVIRYVVDTYKGQTARIGSYGLYKVDNLINDLAKVSGLRITKDVDESEVDHNKAEIREIKSHVNKFIFEDELDHKGLLESQESQMYNKMYDGIITHFSRLYKKVRFIGTHSAGVAVTGGNILSYTGLRTDKVGDLYANYDLNDLENINIIKFDMLGLKTMESIAELRELTGIEEFNYDWITDEKVMEVFSTGKTDGVFQFDKNSVKGLLQKINCDCFRDISAANAMNRPGPLHMGMPDEYANNKENIEEAKQSHIWEYTKDTYGTLIYQEQIQRICVFLAGMTWPEADKIMKMIGGQSQSEDAQRIFEENKKKLGSKFIKGCIANGLPKDEAESIWDMMMVYSFNKGHSDGYSLISVEEAYYKAYHPVEYWLCKLKYAINDDEKYKFSTKAVADDIFIFLPHVNYSTPHARIRVFDGEKTIQRGLIDLKGVGEKAADEIAAERKRGGIFTSRDNFLDRCKSRVVNKRVLEILEEQGAMCFKKDTYLNRCMKLNSTLMAQSLK